MEQICFFPGCSLATSAKENYESLKIVCSHLGVELIELEGWNCCGTSSAHSINLDLARYLALRNIALAQDKKRMLVACPSCFLRLKSAYVSTKKDNKKRKEFEEKYKISFPEDFHIVHILEFLNEYKEKFKPVILLNGLKVAPYYGCMLNIPIALREEPINPYLIESIMETLDGKPLLWPYKRRCCGTFLAVVKPRYVTNLINEIFLSAIKSGAECLVTTCSMCHLTLEMRCTLSEKIPVFHFSEILAMSYASTYHIDWFKRHLIDPTPLLKEKGLI